MKKPEKEDYNILFSPFHSLRTVRYPVKFDADQRKKILI